MKKKETEIVVKNEEQIPTEIIAASIVKLSQASQRMLSSGLNRRALEVLLEDASSVPMSDISRVLNALPRLAELYTVTANSKKR